MRQRLQQRLAEWEVLHVQLSATLVMGASVVPQELFVIMRGLTVIVERLLPLTNKSLVNIVQAHQKQALCAWLQLLRRIANPNLTIALPAGEHPQFRAQVDTLRATHQMNVQVEGGRFKFHRGEAPQMDVVTYQPQRQHQQFRAQADTLRAIHQTNAPRGVEHSKFHRGEAPQMDVVTYLPRQEQQHQLVPAAIVRPLVPVVAALQDGKQFLSQMGVLFVMRRVKDAPNII